MSKKMIFGISVCGIFCSALTMNALAESAKDYPSKPVRIIVPYSAGGGTDETVRVYAKYFEKLTGQPVIVENKPGGSTLVAAAALKNRAADGYNLGVMTRGIHTGYLLNKDKTSINPLEDFTFLVGTHGSVFGLLANNDNPINTVEELVEAAKKEPGKYSVSNIGVGTAHNLVGLELASLAGIDLIHIGYKGEAEGNAAVLGGHVDFGVSSGSFIPTVEGKKLKVIALAMPERLKEYPDWPTFKEQGYDVQVNTLVGLGAPKDISPEVIARIEEITKQITEDPGFQKDLKALYQPVTFVGHEDYQKSQVEQSKKEYDILKRHNLID